MDNRILALSSAGAKMKRGNPKGDTPHLAHDFAKQSVVCYTLYLCVCEKIGVGEIGCQSNSRRKELASVPVLITEAKLFYSQIEGI